MYASRASSLLAFAFLLFCNTASAGPAVRRAGESSFQVSAANVLIAREHLVSEGPLDPWVSVDASGSPVATITPFISTINGVETTVSAADTTSSATPTSQSNSKPTELSVSNGGGSYQVCHNLDGDFAPLCQPDNGTALYVGQTYYGELCMEIIRETWLF